MKREQQAFPDEFNNGMTLRDYFAASASEEDINAMRSLFQCSNMSRAEAKFRYADTMIKAREAK